MKRTYKALVSLLFSTAVLLAGCSGNGNSVDTAPPEIVSDSQSPSDQATEVPVNTEVSFTFNKKVDGVSQSTVMLNSMDTTVAVNANLTYDPETRTVTLKPVNPLSVDSYYVVKVTSGIHSLSGVPFEGTSWLFTTGAKTDTVKPSVTSVTPNKGASYVSTDDKISVTFSESVQSGSVSADVISGGTVSSPGSFRVKNLRTGSYISGKVTYDSAKKIAVFEPGSVVYNSSGSVVSFSSIKFADWTNYQVELTSTIKDIAGNGLASGDYTLYSFMTDDENDPFLSGVSPSEGATGVSRSAQVKLSFSETVVSSTVMTASNFYLEDDATHEKVLATVSYDAENNIATLYPVNPSPLAANTTYHVYVTDGIKDLATNSLSSKDWKFTTNGELDTTPPTILDRTPAQNNLSVSPETSVVVKFSEDITGGLTSIKLTNTSTSAVIDSTIVYSAPTLTLTLTPKMALDQNTSYTVALTDSIKDISGNALSSTSWSFTTADNTKPTVTNKIPGAQGNIAVNSNVTVYFSKRLLRSTVENAANFTVSADGVYVSGSLNYNDADKSVTFDPDASFAYSTTYTVTLLSGIKDRAGNTLNPVTWQFVTGSQPDTTAPVLTSKSPDTGASSISISSLVSFAFSEPLSAGCINTNTVSLTGGSGTSIPISVEYYSDSNSVIVRPSSSLSYSMTYTVSVKGDYSGSEIKDLSGNQFVNASWNFTTEADTQAPTIIYRSPEKGTTGIAGNTVQIDVAFSEKVTGVTTSSFYIEHQGDSYNPNSISIMKVTDISDESKKDYRWRLSIENPYNSSNLTGGTIPDGESGWYNVHLTSAITDTAVTPNALTGSSDWTLKIEGKDNTVPTYTHDPATGAVWRRNGGVYKIRTYFSEAVKNVDASSFKLEKTSGESVPYDVSYDSGLLSAVLTVDSDYAASNNNLYDMTFNVKMLSSITDVAGNPLSYDQWTLTTDSDTDPPTVTSVYPANGQTLVPYNSGLVISAGFSEAVQNVTSATFYLVKQGTTTPVISGTVSPISSSSYKLVTSADLEGLQWYEAHLTTGIKDKAVTPNTLGSEYVWSFKTTEIPDSVKPYINSVSNSSGGTTNLPQNATFNVVFSEAMQNDSGQVSSLISLHKGSSSGSSVSVNVDYNPLTLTAKVTPADNLIGATDYYLVTSSSLKDIAGNQLDISNGNNVYHVKTAPDTAGPVCTIKYVSASSYADFVSGDTLNVANPRFRITFSEAVTGVNSSTVTLYNGSTSIPVYVTYDQSTGVAEVQLKEDGTNVVNGKLFFNGASPLYTITVTSSVTDATGNELNKTSTVSASDTVKTFYAPNTDPAINSITICGASVSNNGSATPQSGSLVLTFSKPMNPNKVWLEIFVSGTDTQAGHSVPVIFGAHAWSSGNTVLTVPLIGQLKGGTTYALRFYGWSGTFEDTFGNLLSRTAGVLSGTDKGIFKFTTDSETVKPTMSSPVSGKTVESNLPAVMFFFNEPMYTGTGFGSVTISNGALGSSTWLDGGRTLVCGVTSLNANATHAVTLSSFKDLSGNALNAGSATMTFYTSSTSAGGPVSLFNGTEGFETFDAQSNFTYLKNIGLTNSVTDSSYLDGVTSYSCNWIPVTSASYSNDSSSGNTTTFGPKSGNSFAQACDWNWTAGSFAEAESVSIDMSASGLYLLSFEMAHIAEFNTSDRIEVYYKKSTDSGFTKLTTASGSYDAIYRYDSSIEISPSSRWKRHYVVLPSLSDGSVKIRMRAVTAGERGASVYIDDVKIERY
jgi:methionine-rich copper-binding protein CopC